MDEEKASEQILENLADVLKARGEQPTPRNMVKLVFNLWLCQDVEGIAIFTALSRRMIQTAMHISDCSDGKFHIDEASAILGEIFIDMSVKQKEAGLSRPEGEPLVLGYSTKEIN